MARCAALRALALGLLAAGCGRGAPAPPPAPAVPACTTWWRTGEPALDRLLPLVKTTLTAQEREFEGRTGQVVGFAADEAHPRFRLREGESLVPLVRWLYPRDRVAGWLAEHLAHQRGDSSLHDWIAAGPPEPFRADSPQAAEIWRRGPEAISGDRHTTVTDQESIAVLAGWELFELYGPIWLDSAVAGRPLLDRLDAALLSVTEARRDTPTGLVVTALTADAGDLSPVHADQNALYLDERTPLVGGLHANALALQAARRLEEMTRAGARPLRARAWEGTASRMRIDLRNALYDPQRGYFRPYRLMRGPQPPQEVDVTTMLATAGNATAARAGALDDGERLRLFAEIDRSHRERGVALSGLSLLPPFPTGFFLHPLLREAGSHRNGGHWDTVAGRLALARLEGGDAAGGAALVRDLVARVVARQAFHEWHTAAGEGRGNPRDAATVGVLGTAVIEGLLGLDWSRDLSRPLHARAVFQPRLGAGRARLEVCVPGEPVRAGYDYEMNASALRLDYRSSANAARVAVLLPPDRVAAEVTLNGVPISVVERRVGNDRYLALDDAPATAELRARLVARTP